MEQKMLTQNERSWAIDVIAAINAYCTTKKRGIAKASGECGLKVAERTLFPDVLLHAGDGAVLHGWELKMPDVPVSDSDLLNNARAKAQSLSSNSFLVWNAKEAVLYSRQSETKQYAAIKNWNDPTLAKREDVSHNPDRWRTLLFRILDDLNQFFSDGTLQATRTELVLGENLITKVLQTAVSPDTESLRQAMARDADLETEIDQWWAINAKEFSGQDKLTALAEINIINWMNRLLFSHYLKKFNSVANQIDKITPGTTIATAENILNRISERCDFLNIFKSSVADQVMSDLGWDVRVQFNALLMDLHLDGLPHAALRNVLDNAVTISRRKLAGQFSTPVRLARLLVNLTLNDRSLPVLDPCCGTGTIAYAAYALKRDLGFTPVEALASVWASDKFQFPLQLTSIALSDPKAMGEVVQVFKSDVFDLEHLDRISFVGPSDDGALVERSIPQFHAITSNLPFVRFEDSAALNPNQKSAVESIHELLESPPEIDGRADLYAHIVLAYDPYYARVAVWGLSLLTPGLALSGENSFAKCSSGCSMSNKLSFPATADGSTPRMLSQLY